MEGPSISCITTTQMIQSSFPLSEKILSPDRSKHSQAHDVDSPQCISAPPASPLTPQTCPYITVSSPEKDGPATSVSHCGAADEGKQLPVHSPPMTSQIPSVKQATPPSHTEGSMNPSPPPDSKPCKLSNKTPTSSKPTISDETPSGTKPSKLSENTPSITQPTLSDKTPSTQLSVPQQRSARITPKQHQPQLVEEEIARAPRAKPPSRRMSEDTKLWMKTDELRYRETRRLSVDLSRELLAENRRMSSASEDRHEVSDLFSDLSIGEEVEDTIDYESPRNKKVTIGLEMKTFNFGSALKFPQEKVQNKISSTQYEGEPGARSGPTSQLDDPNNNLAIKIKSIATAGDQFTKSSIPKLFNLQNKDGSWALTEDLCSTLGIDFDSCMNILTDSGIKSLVKKSQEEIMKLLATSLSILVIIKLESPDWVPGDIGENFWKNDLRRWLAESTEGGTIQLDEEYFPPHEQMIKTVCFYEKQENLFRMASSSLQLGNSWGEVAAKMLGMHS